MSLRTVDRQVQKILENSTDSRLKSDKVYGRALRNISWGLLDRYTLSELESNSAIWRNAMRRAGFNDLIIGVRNEQITLEKHVLEAWSDYDSQKFPDPVVKRLKRIREQDTYRFKNVADEDVMRFQKVVEEAIIREQNRKWLRDQLALRSGMSARHCDTLSRTAMSGYCTATNMEKYDIAGIEKFFYAGLMTEHTRPFCLAHLGNVYTRAEINQMSNNNLEPVWIHRGGYNCIHRWVGEE